MAHGLQYLPAFVAAIHTGSFSSAARQLHVTQSTVSYQIGQLEARLGAALFERVGRGVQPTPLGRRLFDSCERFLGELTALRAAGSRAVSATPAVLRLISGSSFGRYVLTPILTADAMRDTLVDLRFGSDEEVFAAVADGRAELGFAYSVRPSNVLAFAAVYRERLIPIAPPGRWAPARVSRRWVADARFVTYEESAAVYARWFEAVFATMPARIRAVSHCAEIEEVAAFVAAGRGLAIVPWHAVARELAAHRLRELRAPDWPEVTNNVYAVTRVGALRSDPAAAVLAAIPR
jgi:DNA-binding transcriptional LysR family regulator